MKTLLHLLLLSLLYIPAIARGDFARAEEFGSPRLDLTPPQFPALTKEELDQFTTLLEQAGAKIIL